MKAWLAREFLFWFMVGLAGLIYPPRLVLIVAGVLWILHNLSESLNDFPRR